MAIFEEVAVAWGDKKFVIPADRMMMTIARVEDVLTLGDLSAYFATGKLPLAKIAQAFGIVLRQAGASVEDEEVYEGMFRAKGQEVTRRAIEAIHMLMALMVPPAHLRAATEEAAAKQGKAKASVEPASSKRPSKPQRRRGG